MSRDESSKIGRPTLYLPEYCEQLVAHMSAGYSFESFAAACDTTSETLYGWTHKYPEFFSAKKRGAEHNRRFWETIGVQMSLGDKEYGKGNVTAWIFNMKNRFDWGDKLSVKSEISGTVNMLVKDLTPEQISEQIKELDTVLNLDNQLELPTDDK